MKKIRVSHFSVLLLLGLPLRLFAGEDLPKPFTLARYQPMMDRSPFAVATAAVAPEAEASFAKDLYIANAARSKEGDLVTIASNTDRNFKKYLSTAAPVDGYSISGIEWSDKVGATKVTISKDGQVATLGFNEALLHQTNPGGQNPPPVQAVAPQDKSAGGQLVTTPAQAQPLTKPMPVPMLPTPPPVVRGVIPRNPASAPQKQPPTKTR
jgi:hypothetical protein